MCASLARRARVVRACRACSARACSCARRRAASVGVAVERPRRASPVATCLFVRLTQSRLSAMRAYTQYFCTPSSRLRFLRSVRAPPPPYSVLLRAALHCAAITAAAWGASECRRSQKPRSWQTEWKHLFLQHSRKRLAQLRSQLLCPWLAHSTLSPKSATRREAPATAARTTMAGHLTQQQQLFQILHGNLQAHVNMNMIYNRRGPCH